LGVNYANFGQSDLAAIYLKRAVELSNRISEREKLETFAAYYSVGTRELDKAIEAYQLWEKTYPDDRLAPANLADGYLRVGQYERCAAASRRAIKMDLIDSVAYENLAFCLINLDQLEEAKKVFDETLSRKLDVAGVRVPIYTLAFLQGDAPEMQKQLAWSAGRPGEEEAWFLSLQADTDAFMDDSAKPMSTPAARLPLRCGLERRRCFASGIRSFVASGVRKSRPGAKGCCERTGFIQKSFWRDTVMRPSSF
jgi:tetratricopeptide (TPR) repeat protein